MISRVNVGILLLIYLLLVSGFVDHFLLEMKKSSGRIYYCCQFVLNPNIFRSSLHR